MELTWYGHSNMKLVDDAVVVIDPFFQGNPKAPSDADAIKSCDLVLVTHDHGDHVGQAVDICRTTGAKLVGVFDTVCKLVDQGLPQAQALGMNIGGTITEAGVRINMVQALHSSASGVATGYILTFQDEFCAYHSGDTGLFGDMELFGRFHDIDLAMLPIDGHFNMDAGQAAYACKLLGCKAVAPMHWGTFPILAQSTDEFAAELKRHAPSTKMVDIRPGQTVTL